MNEILKTLAAKEGELETVEQQAATLRIEINLLKNLAGKPVNEKFELRGTPDPSRIKTFAQKLQDTPDISLRDAAYKGIRELGEFTKKDLQNWIERAYPKLGTKFKSLDRVIYQAIDAKDVTLFRKNFGARRPAVYKWMNGQT